MGAFDLTIGGFLMGLSFDLYLYGFVFNQYLAYKTTKFDDPLLLRIIVAALFVIDTSQVAVELYTVWYFLVENYANPNVLNHVFWTLPLCGVTTAISALIVETFLINRLYQLMKRFWLCIVLVVAAAVASLFGAAAGIWSGVIKDINKLTLVIPLEIVWLSTIASVDIVINVTLSRTLWRSKAGFPGTDTIINRCIRASIQSGLFSSVFALASLAGFVFWTNTHVNLIFGFPLGRIYSNSLLYTLVSRKEYAEISNRVIEIRYAGSFLLPHSPEVSPIRLQRETVTEAKVVGNAVNPSLDGYIIFPPPTVGECSQPASPC
ncbi:hypothetical protein DL96DRAFT_375953 [Flagelloscypha sp. PMI_526]|nr:hypothetical protein DL96DRAFT_375953 [Flagelloscypha sp. PMI_526]